MQLSTDEGQENAEHTHLLANSPPGGRLGMFSLANVRITWTKSGTPSPCFFMISGNQKYLFCKCYQNLIFKTLKQRLSQTVFTFITSDIF